MDKQTIIQQTVLCFTLFLLFCAVFFNVVKQEIDAKKYIEECEQQTNDYAGCYDRFYGKKENK